MKKCVKKIEYKCAVIEAAETPSGVNCCIMDAFTGDLLDEYQHLSTAEEAFVRAKSIIDKLLPSEQLQENLSQGFAYVRYIS